MITGLKIQLLLALVKHQEEIIKINGIYIDKLETILKSTYEKPRPELDTERIAKEISRNMKEDGTDLLLIMTEAKENIGKINI